MTCEVQNIHGMKKIVEIDSLCFIHFTGKEHGKGIILTFAGGAHGAY